MPPDVEPGVEMATPRLWLRRWRAEDLEPFAALNADPEVMAHFPSTLSREETAEAVGRIEQHFENRGYGFWAAEATGPSAVHRVHRAGGACLSKRPSLPASKSAGGWRVLGGDRDWPQRERGPRWRTDSSAWDWREIVSFTVPGNTRSRRVMEKLGMRYSEDFEHPRIDPQHPLSRHVLYRLSRAEWANQRRS